MLANKRQELILKELRQSGQVLVSTLAEALCVSDETIRRDIAAMHKAGVLRRVHGGAVLPQHPLQEPAYPKRAESNPEGKRLIGQLAASFVSDHDVILIGHGATTDTIVPFLAAKDLTVITSSIMALNQLIQAEQSGQFTGRVLLLGGSVDTANYCTNGPFAEHMLQMLSVDKAFIGVTAVDSDGIHMFHQSENALATLMIARAHQTYILAEHAKLEKRALYKTCDLDAVHHLITDRIPPLSTAFTTALQKADLTLYDASLEVSHASKF